MNIKIKGVDIEVTESIRDYSDKKVYEALKKFKYMGESSDIFVEIELSKTNNHHNNGELYNVSIKVSGTKKNIFVEESKDDLYAAIDAVKDKLEYRLSEDKDKKLSVHHKLAVKFKKMFRKGE
ncbi:MAG: ribosome-associated translation inhibitor RaiA [Candidatus Pacebacteria bacterium]|nr:ribosome-associated translation inhibitor RaiA [Candidatus Paceibacterota bacterium]